MMCVWVIEEKGDSSDVFHPVVFDDHFDTPSMVYATRKGARESLRDFKDKGYLWENHKYRIKKYKRAE